MEVEARTLDVGLYRYDYLVSPILLRTMLIDRVDTELAGRLRIFANERVIEVFAGIC